MEREPESLHMPLVPGLSSTATTSTQRRIALILCAVLLGAVLFALPYAHTPFLRIPVFLAYYTAIALFADLLTARLLFARFL
jgi:hypothetical protein